MKTPNLVIDDRTLYFTRKDGDWFIALKPICEALGLKWAWYFEALKADPILSQLFRETGIVAADGRLRNMICLPERFIYGWLFQLQSKNEKLLAFKRTCYDALFDHFHGTGKVRVEELRARAVAQQEIGRLQVELREDPRIRRIQELEAVVKNTGKRLRAVDLEIEREQLELFAEEPVALPA